jgi:hypothetical protein
MNALLDLSNHGELHSYMDLPETPRMSCIWSESVAWNNELIDVLVLLTMDNRFDW